PAARRGHGYSRSSCPRSRCRAAARRQRRIRHARTRARATGLAVLRPAEVTTSSRRFTLPTAFVDDLASACSRIWTTSGSHASKHITADKALAYVWIVIHGPSQPSRGPSEWPETNRISRSLVG